MSCGSLSSDDCVEMKERRIDSKGLVRNRCSGFKARSNSGSEFNVESDDSSIHDHVSRGYMRFENKVRIDMDAMSKVEMNELRRRLSSELEQVRTWRKKLDIMGVHKTEYCGNRYNRQAKEEIAKSGGSLKVDSKLPSVGKSGVTENGAVGSSVKKAKMTAGGNQLRPGMDIGVQREKSPPPEISKKVKPVPVQLKKNLDLIFRSCSNVLTLLMKHKFGWIFNKPVDVKGLGLFDYHTIVKHPMDLGTVKNMLSKNWYKSPLDFAEDVRLTFRNAMAYNPKEQDAHIAAKLLLEIFEQKWAVIEAEYNRDSHLNTRNGADLPLSASKKAALPPHPQIRISDRSEPVTANADSNVMARPTPVPDKPLDTSPPKKHLTHEEKQRLGMDLQNLPPEKLDGVVDIIRRRNSALYQEDEEIELDIETVDAETLWELDRYVANYKRSVQKNDRKGDVAIQTRAEAGSSNQRTDLVPVTEASGEAKRAVGERLSRFSVHGERQGDNVSRSSSSNSSSSDSGSSSSDSDSDSSPS